jgi:hypothetical protein
LATNVLCVSHVVTLPRQIFPDTAYMATRRTRQQLFLIRPDERMTNDIIYAIAVCSEHHGIQVIDFIALSNHLHQIFYALYANAPDYLRDLHCLLAKVVNARFGESESLWSSAKPSLVELLEEDALVEKLVYTATNPIKHGLVERLEDWPGAKGYLALLTGKPLKATKPKSFLSRRNKKWPEKVKLRLRIPKELGDHDRIMQRVIPRVAAATSYFARQRAVTGQPVLGRYRVLRASRHDAPKTRALRRELSPTIAGKDEALRFAAIQRKRDFQRGYRTALLAYRADKPIPFPAGTYWLVRNLGVAVNPIEKLS